MRQFEAASMLACGLRGGFALLRLDAGFAPVSHWFDRRFDLCLSTGFTLP